MEIRLCIDCVFADANGAGTAEHDGGPSADWTGFLPEWDGWGFVGKVYRVGDDIEIAEPHFGRSPCDGCGSGLGGDRWDYDAWVIRQDAS